MDSKAQHSAIGSGLPVMLFQGDDIWVAALGAPSETVVCTFSTFDDCAKRWAEGQITRYGNAGIFFGCRANLWWQSPEMALATRAAGAFAKGFDRRLGYSASMGAFGALQWANEIGLNEIVAVAPQVRIGPGSRLKPEWKIPSRIYRDDVAASLSLRPTIIFDPHDPYDAWQADQLADRCERWPTPLAGHKVLETFRDAGRLGKFMRLMFEGRLTASTFRSMYRQARRSSTAYAAQLDLYRSRRLQRPLATGRANLGDDDAGVLGVVARRA